MGYGSRALSLLKQYYKGEVVSLSETVDSEPQTNVVDDQVTYNTLLYCKLNIIPIAFRKTFLYIALLRKIIVKQFSDANARPNLYVHILNMYKKILLFPILSSNTSNSIHMGFLKVQLKHKITQILSL